MTRLGSMAKAGFFPTPTHLLPAIAAQIAPSTYTTGSSLDLFCGEGEAAEFLGAAWGLQTVGVELNPVRARAARRRLTRAICSDAFQVRGTHGQFDVALHNPPYQESPDDSGQRLEYVTTLAVTPYIRSGGFLVGILPDYCVRRQKFVDFLTTNYQLERVFRFPEADYEAFRQIVLYARKRDEPRKDPQAALTLIEAIRGSTSVLPTTCAKPLTLPTTPIVKERIFFRGRELDREAMLEELRTFKWARATAFTRLATPRVERRAGRPAMPLKLRHLAQFIAAAILDNVALRQDEQTHVICGRTRKFQVESEMEDNDAGEAQTLVRQEFAVECRAFDPATGVFLEFNEGNAAELRAYIQEWRKPLVGAVQDAFPPLYNFDFRGTFPSWLVEYIENTVARRASLEGRAGKGLFEGQKHALGATLAKLLEFDPATGGQRDFFIDAFGMGFGKTMIAAAAYGALVRLWDRQRDHAHTTTPRPAVTGWPPAIFVTEPTLLEQTAGEISKADPFLRPRIVRNVREVDAFLVEARTAPWPMVLLTSRTSVKDGFGWRPAVVLRKHGKRVKDPGGASDDSKEVPTHVVVETRYHCPTCGVLQREIVRESAPDAWPPVRDIEYFSERRVCSNSECGAPLWQDYRQVGGRVGGKTYRPEYWECAQHWHADKDRWALLSAREQCADQPTKSAGSLQCGDVRLNELERIVQINELVCKTRRLGAIGEFKLVRGDVLMLSENSERLLVKRDSRWLAQYDFASGDVLDNAPYEPDPTQKSRRWRVPGDRRELTNPPFARRPVAEHLLRLAKNGERFLLCIIDELQKFKAIDTNAGYALGKLLGVADKTLALTGTLYGGYASHMFPLLYRSDAAFRAHWPHRGMRDFVARYGLLEWVENRKANTENEDDGLGYSELSGYRRRREKIRELPAISPELTALLLDRTLFLGLQDLGFDMVALTEQPHVVTAEEDFRSAFDDFLDDTREAFKAAKEEEVNIAGAFLHAMLSYSAAPWRRTEIRDRKTNTLWAWAPDLEIVCKHCGRTLFKARQCRACHTADTPRTCRIEGCGEKRRRVFHKEQRLLDNLLAAKAAGRPALVLVIHTDRLDLIEPRWTGPDGLCAQVGLRAVNGNVWSAKKRMQMLERAVLEGADVVFVNPAQIETGMNLIWFPEIHWLQLSYSLFLVEQAGARSWRPTQTQDVDIHYYCVDDTYETRALARVVQKRIARLTLRGDAVDSALDKVVAGADTSLLRQIIEDVAGTEVTDLGALFEEYNLLARETAQKPSEFLTVDGANHIHVETRSAHAQPANGKANGHGHDQIALVENGSITTSSRGLAAPAQQLTLFG